MVGIFALWLPILLAAVVVFITSAVFHMVLPHHRTDWKRVPQEDDVLASLRAAGVAPGDYALPFMATDKETRESEAFKQKLEQGPLVVMTVLPKGAFTSMMGKTMGLWFVYCLVVSLFVAYATELAYGSGADYMEVFRFAGTVAFGFYALGIWPHHIWFKSSGATALKSTLDSFVYGLMTAGVFGWLWP